MRFVLTVAFTLAALLLDPVVEQAFGGIALHPNLRMAPLAVAVVLCPGAVAVVWCGVLGLVLDCLAGPQLGVRVACFCLLAALASTVASRRNEASFARTIAVSAGLLFVAEMLSRLIEFSSSGGPLQLAKWCVAAFLSATATTAFLGLLWLGGEFLSGWAPRSLRRLALPSTHAGYRD
jgi:rod shape-determining protein MreD